MNIIPAVLFCLIHIESRKESILAGFTAGIIGIIPACLFYIAVLGQYPSVLPQEIPAVYVLRNAGVPILLIIFQVVLLGTLIETGTGFIHAVNERIQSALKDKGKKLPPSFRPLMAVFFILIGLGMASFGLIALIAKGYGALSWGVFAIYIVPLITVGVYKIAKRKNVKHFPEKSI
jgi:uncharacterized membrane protein YkvI